MQVTSYVETQISIATVMKDDKKLTAAGPYLLNLQMLEIRLEISWESINIYYFQKETGGWKNSDFGFRT